MNNREMAGIIDRLQGLERWMKTKETVEIDGGIRRSVRAGYCEVRPKVVICGFAVRDHNVQTIHGAALKDGDEVELTVEA